MIATKTNKHPFDWKFGILWTLATTMGLVLGIAISLLVISGISKLTNIDEDTIAIFIILPSIGFSIGFLQWLNLRKRVSWASMWIWVTAAGWVISIPLALSLYTWLQSISASAFVDVWGKTIQATMIAILIGTIQWLLLRRHISRAGWWILANLIGWKAASLTAVAGAMVSVLDSIPMGISVGVITGLVLAWLLQQPRMVPNTTKLDSCTLDAKHN
jgi:hypothetical protein